jgi:hypothetical protein
MSPSSAFASGVLAPNSAADRSAQAIHRCSMAILLDDIGWGKMAAPAILLDLDRRVPDAEPLPQVVRDRLQEVVVHSGAGTDDVGGERRMGCAQAPDVQVVDRGDAGKPS